MIFKDDIQNNTDIQQMGGVFTYVLTVTTNRPETICVRISNDEKPRTVYLDRYKVIDGEFTFYIRMPQSPKMAKIEVWNAKNTPDAHDYSFNVVELAIKPLATKFSAFDIQNPKIVSFIKFAQKISENSAILDTYDENGAVYMSDDGLYDVCFMDVLRDEDGQESSTPSRIHKLTKVIEISKYKFDQMTVAGRMAILLHEMSHGYLNKVMENETEADLNALMIYLGLGYPRIEAETVFLKTFIGNPHDMNVERYKKLDTIIRNFDKMDFKLI